MPDFSRRRFFDILSILAALALYTLSSEKTPLRGLVQSSGVVDRLVPPEVLVPSSAVPSAALSAVVPSPQQVEKIEQEKIDDSQLPSIDFLSSNRGGCKPDQDYVDLMSSLQSVPHSMRLTGNGNRTFIYRAGRLTNAYTFFDAELKEDPNATVIRYLPHYDDKHSTTLGSVVTLRDAFVGGEFSTGFDCRITYFAGGCRSWSAKFPQDLLTQTPIEVGDAVVISQYWGFGFYHWFIENFMRLGIVLDFLIANPHVKIIRYNLDGQSKDYANEYFKMIGIDPNRIIPYGERRLYHGRRLMFPSGSICGRPQSPAIRRITKEVRKNIQKDYSDRLVGKDINGPVLVLQDRGAGRKRSLSNHGELLAQLRSNFPDFNVIEFGPKLSPIEAAIIHFHAKFIVGPHGAGLSNVVFTDGNDCTVIEVHPSKGNGDIGPNKVNVCHELTARATGSHHVRLIADNGNTESPIVAPIDIIIDEVRKDAIRRNIIDNAN